MNEIKAVSSSVAKMTIRNKDGGTDEVTLNRSKAIRAFCLECSGWSTSFVAECSSMYCPLFAFRFGGSVLAALKKTEKLEAKAVSKAEKKVRKPRVKKEV